MQFTVLTLFPELIDAFFNHGMIARALGKKLISGTVVNIRDFAFNRHNSVDDRPYGGGCGMVMTPEPLFAAIHEARQLSPGARVILMSPQGTPFDQDKACEFASAYASGTACASVRQGLDHAPSTSVRQGLDHASCASTRQGLVFVCGRYEGIDERVFTACVDEEISIGDYVMTGGELAAMVIMDAVTRLIPGVLGGDTSAAIDSFRNDRLEHAHYTRPPQYEGLEVPAVLLSGNHEKIEQWRTRSALKRTLLKRPDLFEKTPFSPEEREILKQWCRK